METPLLLRVVDVEYLKDYTMNLEFNDGTKKKINFLPLLNGKMFEPLRDRNKFIQFGLNSWTIEWSNGADMSPEFLYSL
ncbi:MAG: DUF2442 domain-containing protein [Bacteroidales bacterium]|jgi:hypothetical protein|nr:DUF2442 domain-containing protein [Bacteroidales bacterium]